MINIPPNYWMILPIAVLVTFGQLLAKWRSLSGGHPGTGSELDAFGHLVTDPVMLSAYAVGFVANVGWLYVLTKLPLTIAFPVYMGVTFTLVLMGGSLFLAESMSLTKVIAVLMILGGVVLALHADA